MSNDLTKDEILAMAREAGAVFDPQWGIASNTGTATFERFATLCRAPLVAEIETLRYELDAVAEIKQERDALRAELGQYPEIQAMLMSENKQLRAEVEAFDKAADSWMRKAIDLEAEVAKLRGLVSGRSAEYLAAHITYDKGYQEGRLDAESLNIPVAEVGVSIFTWLGDRPPAGTTLYRIDQL